MPCRRTLREKLGAESSTATYKWSLLATTARATTVQGTTVQGTTVQGTTVQGTAVQGTTVQGTTARATTAQGTTAQDTTAEAESDLTSHRGWLWKLSTRLSLLASAGFARRPFFPF